MYPQNILGDEHPQFGLARNSWLSGTASWTYQAATQYILGIQPAYDGLRLDPCLPSAWGEVSIVRRFRGAEYHINLHNPRHVCKGIHRLMVDGAEIPGNRIPLAQPGAVVKVEAWLG